MAMNFMVRLSKRNRVLVHLAVITLAALALNVALQYRAQPEAQIAFHETPVAVPGISFIDRQGGIVTMADFKGKVVVLNIWATWCVPCREEMPSLNNLQAIMGGEDFQVVALSIDETGFREIEYFYEQYEIRHLVIYLDEGQELYDQLNVVAIPTSLIIDRRGLEIGRMIGAATWDSDRMIATLGEIIGKGRP